MRELYNDFFHVPKHGKIREKVMLTRVVTTVTIVILCLAAMSFTAYAYFSHDITSGSNTIQAAKFEAQITVTSTEQNGGTVNPSSTSGKKTVFTFADTGTYTVELEKGSSSAKTGFCIVTVGNEEYHTQQIGVDINANNEQRDLVSFTLKINEPNAVVTIESHWGTSSYYGFSLEQNDASYIMNDPHRVIVIGNPVNGASDSNEQQNGTGMTPTEIIHTVAFGENLTKIANLYQTTPERIAIYNEIDDPNVILERQKLKIPPSEWESEETTETLTTEQNQ